MTTLSDDCRQLTPLVTWFSPHASLEKEEKVCFYFLNLTWNRLAQGNRKSLLSLSVCVCVFLSHFTYLEEEEEGTINASNVCLCVWYVFTLCLVLTTLALPGVHFRRPLCCSLSHSSSVRNWDSEQLLSLRTAVLLPSLGKRKQQQQMLRDPVVIRV